MRHITLITLVVLVGCGALTGPYTTVGPINKPYKDILSTAKGIIIKEGFRVTLLDEENGYLETAWDVLPVVSLTVKKRARVLMTFEKQDEGGYTVGIKVPIEELEEDSTYWLPSERDTDLEGRILQLLKIKLMEIQIDD